MTRRQGGGPPPREPAPGKETARTAIRAFVRTLEKVTAAARPKPARKDIPP